MYQYRVISGETYAAPQDDVAAWPTGVLPKLLKDYAPDNIFKYNFCGEDCIQECMTVLPYANMTGFEMLPHLIICRFAKTQCFMELHALLQGTGTRREPG